MADLTADLVICPRCGRTLDRSGYAQCPADGEDLWVTAARTAQARAPDTTLDARESTDTIAVVIAGTEFVLDANRPLALGRDEQYPTAAALAAHTNISRYHGLLRFDGTALFVTDTASRNGTYVNGTRLATNTEYQVRPGQVLRLAADVEVEVRWPRWPGSVSPRQLIAGSPEPPTRTASAGTDGH